MLNKNKVISFFLVLSLMLVSSCEKKVIEPIKNPIPSKYDFKDASNISTVDINGQKIRLMMLDEMSSITETGNMNLTEQLLLDMYEGKGFSESSLNASGKKLSDKVAASIDYFSEINNAEQMSIRTEFKRQFKELETAYLAKKEASLGSPGYYLDGGKTRYFSSNGLEPIQVFKKGMMGALMMDQTLNNYLSTQKLDGGSTRTANTAKLLATGKNYTEMEHYWDEAFGYVFGQEDNYWAEYINEVSEDPDFKDLKPSIYNAFIKGRVAISAGDYPTRDLQIEIIRKQLSKIPAIRAVFYLLNEARAEMQKDNGRASFHAFSEAYGFISCLKFTHQPNSNTPYFSAQEVTQLLNLLMAGKDGLYDVDYVNNTIEGIAKQIADRFGFTVAQAIN